MSQTTPHHTPTLNFYHPAAQEHLLQAAAESGAAVRRGARVTRVQPGTPATVMVEQDGHTEELHARLVVGADARRARAFPLLAEDPTRLPDLLGLGPAVSTDETVRRRFFGEE